MPVTPKLVLDTFSEVYNLLKPYADAEFWDFAQHEIIPGATYVVGRKQCIDNREQLLELARSNTIQLIISNPHEGSETLAGQLTRLGFGNTGIKIIGGGDMPPAWPCLRYDKFLPEILDYEDNLIAIQYSDEIYQQEDKPYQFLFLNGRRRWHRTELIRQLEPVLDSALWTYLDAGPGLSTTLPPKYEVPRYSNTANPVTDHSYVKFDLFRNEWGEIYLHPPPYIDTYFSVVTETVFDIPYSFRTEKTWKPIVMGHPWITAANRGFYRDMHNLGFRTFGTVINESFDLIDNNEDRLARIADIVQDLCRQNLVAFLRECRNICKYNQYHHREMAQQVRREFPDRFFQFINE